MIIRYASNIINGLLFRGLCSDIKKGQVAAVPIENSLSLRSEAALKVFFGYMPHLSLLRSEQIQQNDPRRFIKKTAFTNDDEIANIHDLLDNKKDRYITKTYLPNFHLYFPARLPGTANPSYPAPLF